jgi:hypothetical protein
VLKKFHSILQKRHPVSTGVLASRWIRGRP